VRARRHLVSLPIVLLAAALLAAAAFARDLSWRALDVKARLDEEGSLHVVERHTMVFSGDWKRRRSATSVSSPARACASKMLAPDRSRRHGPRAPARRAARPRPVHVEGQEALRWRSRRPSDPEFSNTELIYEIAYTLSGILTKEGDRYVLDNSTSRFPPRRARSGSSRSR
jgi:hypothetical protein